MARTRGAQLLAAVASSSSSSQLRRAVEGRPCRRWAAARSPGCQQHRVQQVASALDAVIGGLDGIERMQHGVYRFVDPNRVPGMGGGTTRVYLT